ncbi:MAG: Flp pilus assembly protein CpaB [Deltaproteobacteria bacterium]|nr:Flp pilus assembly protein CpaB [Deltaproteobacteria bacterium]
MKKTRVVGVVGVALVLALAAGLGAHRFLSQKSALADEARLHTAGIAVALVDIQIGSTINSNQVGLSTWPKDLYPKDAFADTKPVVGRMAMRDFLRGEPFVESKLVPTDKNGGLLSLKVPAGMRAFTVKVNEVVGVGGFIVPDSRVDVVVTTAVSPQRQQDQVSKTFLQDVLVLAAGQIVEQKDNKPITVNTVTLAVSPPDAEKLALASNDGKIQLVLRHISDKEKVETPGSDKGRLLSSLHQKPVPAAAEGTGKRQARRAPREARRKSDASDRGTSVQVARSQYVVEVIKAGKRSEEKFE